MVHEQQLQKNPPEASAQPHNKECDNCHAPINGPFCSQCGQEAESTLKYFWTVILHILDDIFSFDSRANRTLLPLLFRPGFLTNQYFAGHRVHYIPPLRLYLFISIIFFISLKFFASADLQSDHAKEVASLSEDISKIEAIYKAQEATPEQTEKLTLLASFQNKLSDIKTKDTIKNRSYYLLIQKLVEAAQKQTTTNELAVEEQEKYQILVTQWQNVLAGKVELNSNSGVQFSNNPDGTFTFDWLTPSANEKLEQATNSIEKKVQNSSFEQLFEQAIDKLPQLMFVLLPLFAVLLKVMYLFSKRLYLEHLTVALHSHSFIFLSVLMIELISLLQDMLASSSDIMVDGLQFIITLGIIWIPVYLYIMQKRVYKQGYFITLMKYGLIGIMYILLLTTAFLIAFIWGVTDLPS
ncbi:DUF3667 domain-containing protein [Thalassotalea sp. 1_MG-2023]|uniref:DUF3667 domain-containing protein n=1 Tax=Thalassotalea sp. 1_MG-2023 TaxID=3062680 RepID=UPI0026E2EFCC|nr:DUF3667 domain-containing protein [Thalassotalea sp. 1_MG-2023]MDO6428035.1 DUF3667 domain-containing protein [Thalassotalea sp. 1_MG-2023]